MNCTQMSVTRFLIPVLATVLLNKMLYDICQIYRRSHLNLSSSALWTATLKSNQLPEMPEQTHTSVLDYSWITNNMIKAVIECVCVFMSDLELFF